MSSSSKRVLPTSSTAALVPNSEAAFHERAHGRSNPNDELIDQLVGGLMRADHPGDGSSRYSSQNHDFGASERTYSIDDEEIDEPPVPIPSTWRDPPNHAEPNWFVEQARASAYGFAVGLFVVIPAVMLLTGQAERLPSWQALVSYAQTSGNEASIADQSGYGEVAPVGTAQTTAQDQSTSPLRETPAAGTLTQAPTTTVASSTVPSELPGSSIAQGQSAPAAVAETPTTETLNQPAAATVAPEREETTATANAEPSSEPAAPANPPAGVASTVRDEPPPAAPKATVIATAPIETTPTQVETRVQTPAPVTTSPPVTQPEATNSPKPAAEPETETQVAAVAAPDQNQAEPAGNATTKPLTLDQPVTMEMARKTIKAGDMDSARVMLAKLASQGNTDAIFALAETFDPNVLAAWGTHGEEADSEKARMFYSMALSHGIDRAAGRLQALQE